MRVFALAMQEKRYPRFAAFPIAKGVVSRKEMLSYRSLPHWGRGTASAVDRVLSQAARLGRSFPLSFMPLEPYPARFARPLPLEGKGDRAAVDRVLSQTTRLGRSFPLFFIPLVPYPARSARHLPLEGKALSVVILFLHVSCIRSDDMGIAASSYRSLPKV